jgi:hypothetical protein
MLIPKPIKGESKRAFSAFQLYVELGDGRKYQEVARRYGCSTQNIENFAAKYHWQDRLAILIAEEAERAADAERQARLEYARKREALRLKHEAAVLSFADPIKAKLDQFAALPIVRQTMTKEVKDAEGRVTEQHITIEPAGINWASFSRVFADWDTRIRLALGMPTGKQEITGADGAVLASGGSAPIINLVVTRDAQSQKVRAIQKEFLEAHPEHPQAERFIREFRERDEGNGGE